MCAEHRPERRINRELSKINSGNNLHNIRPEVINGIPNLFVILGTITVPANAENIDNAGNIFLIRIQLPHLYPFQSPKIYVNGEEFNFIDVIGYHINLENTGHPNWNEYAGINPIVNYDLNSYFAGDYFPDENGWMDWVPVISLETTFKIIQYMLERNGPAHIRCNIDFTIIPTLPINEVANLDLSEDVDPITLEDYIPGNEYYRVTKVIPQENGGPPTTSVIYCSIEALQSWLGTQHQIRCKHPTLLNIVINQEDIRSFVYTGPTHVVGGSQPKRKSRTLRQKNRKSKSNK